MRRSSVSAPAPSEATIAVRIGQWTSYSAEPAWLQPAPALTPPAPKTSEIFSSAPVDSIERLVVGAVADDRDLAASAETVSAEARQVRRGERARSRATRAEDGRTWIPPWTDKGAAPYRTRKRSDPGAGRMTRPLTRTVSECILTP